MSKGSDIVNEYPIRFIINCLATHVSVGQCSGASKEFIHPVIRSLLVYSRCCFCYHCDCVGFLLRPQGIVMSRGNPLTPRLCL